MWISLIKVLLLVAYCGIAALMASDFGAQVFYAAMFCWGAAFVVVSHEREEE